MLSIAILSSISASILSQFRSIHCRAMRVAASAKLPHQPVTDLYASSAISLLPLNAAAKSLSRQTGSAGLASYIIRLPHQAYLSASDFQKSHRQVISSARCSLNKVIVPLCARFAYANITNFTPSSKIAAVQLKALLSLKATMELQFPKNIVQ